MGGVLRRVYGMAVGHTDIRIGPLSPLPKSSNGWITYFSFAPGRAWPLGRLCWKWRERGQS